MRGSTNWKSASEREMACREARSERARASVAATNICGKGASRLVAATAIEEADGASRSEGNRRDS
jgi:hypothetical protein